MGEESEERRSVYDEEAWEGKPLTGGVLIYKRLLGLTISTEHLKMIRQPSHALNHYIVKDAKRPATVT